VLHAGRDIVARGLVGMRGVEFRPGERRSPLRSWTISAKSFGKARLAGHREPLNAVLVGAGSHAEKFGDVSVEFGDGIGIEDFFFEGQGVACSAPFGAATQVAFAIERDDGRFFEGRT
jgi:hypothetical protein